MLFNINDYVKVKLTDYGKMLLEKQHFELYESLGVSPIPYTPPKKDENGYVKFQLWVLMSNFGSALMMSGDTPFETEIIICKGE